MLGVHYRLIEGFSAGFGFNAVAVALIASVNPIAVLPAGLFFGFLEAGALAMQREVGVPSSLVFVIQGPDHGVRSSAPSASAHAEQKV